MECEEEQKRLSFSNIWVELEMLKDLDSYKDRDFLDEFTLEELKASLEKDVGEAMKNIKSIQLQIEDFTKQHNIDEKFFAWNK